MSANSTSGGLTALRDNAPFLTCTAGVVAISYAAEYCLGFPGLTRDFWRASSFTYLIVFLLLPLPLALLVGRLRVRDAQGRFVSGAEGWRRGLARFHHDYTRPARVLRAVTAGAAIALLINVYGSWKRALPAIREFNWDVRLAEFDRAVHLGADPWRLIQPWLGTPNVTLALDTVYYTWLPVTFATMGWLVWSCQTRLRKRALLGVAFVWIGLGNVLAFVFSSAGPAFYAYLAPAPNPFVPLLDYLGETATQVPLFAPRLQDTLWRLYVTGKTDIYTGISAMPSVHVAMPALSALAGWERNRWLGLGFGVYTLLILVATVHLGWHYAIDGYLSVIAVAVFWVIGRAWDRRVGKRRVA